MNTGVNKDRLRCRGRTRATKPAGAESNSLVDSESVVQNGTKTDQPSVEKPNPVQLSGNDCTSDKVKSPQTKQLAGCTPVANSELSDKSTDMNPPGGDINEDDETSLGFCQICGKDLHHMNEQRKLQHINRCLDESESSDSHAVPQEPASVPCCPICGQELKTENLRRIHLKKCAARFNIPPSEMVEIVRKQLDEIKSQEAANGPGNTAISSVSLSPVSSPAPSSVSSVHSTSNPGQLIRRKRRSTSTEAGPLAERVMRKCVRRRRLEEPHSKFDEDTQLAIALSVSTSENANDSVGELAMQNDHGDGQLPADSTSLSALSALVAPKANPSAPAGCRKRARKQHLSKSHHPLPLLALDQDVLQKRLEARVTEMITVHKTLDSTGSCLPSSHLQSKYKPKVTDISKFDVNVLWEESSLARTYSGEEFYVHELEPYVSLSSLPVPSRVEAVQSQGGRTLRSDCTLNVTLYGSTQTAVDLAELAAEAGNQTVLFDDLEASMFDKIQHGTSVHSSEGVTTCLVSGDTLAKQPVVSDGFCLQTSEASELAKADLLQMLEGLVNSKEHSDMTLRLRGGETVSVHRLLLGLRCPALIGLADSNGVVALEEFDVPTATACLRYVYAGIVDVSHDIAFEVKSLAEHLKLDALVKICSELIETNDLQPTSHLANSSSAVNGDALTALNIDVPVEMSETNGQAEKDDDADDDLNEVYVFMATQKQRRNSAKGARRKRKSRQYSEMDSNTEMSVCSHDSSSMCLSQGILDKLQETFNSDGENSPDKTLRSPYTTDSTLRRADFVPTIADVWHFSPVSDDDDVKQEGTGLGAGEEDMVTTNAEAIDPCLKFYDKVNVDEYTDLSTANKSEAGKHISAGSEMVSSLYSAPSPPLLFDEDSAQKEVIGANCAGASSMSCFLACSQSGQPLKVPVDSNGDLEKLSVGSPYCDKSSVDRMQNSGRCMSPEDLFGSPQSQPSSEVSLSAGIHRKTTAESKSSRAILRSPDIPIPLSDDSDDGDTCGLPKAMTIPLTTLDTDSSDNEIVVLSLRKVRAKTRNSVGSTNSSPRSAISPKSKSSCASRRRNARSPCLDVEPTDDDDPVVSPGNGDVSKVSCNSAGGSGARRCFVKLKKIKSNDSVSLQVDGTSILDGDSDENAIVNVDENTGDGEIKERTCSQNEGVLDNVWDGFTENDGAEMCMFGNDCGATPVKPIVTTSSDATAVMPIMVSPSLDPPSVVYSPEMATSSTSKVKPTCTKRSPRKHSSSRRSDVKLLASDNISPAEEKPSSLSKFTSCVQEDGKSGFPCPQLNTTQMYSSPASVQLSPIPVPFSPLNSPSPSDTPPKPRTTFATPSSTSARRRLQVISPSAAYSPPTDMDTDVSALMEQVANTSEMWRSDVSFEESKATSTVNAPVLPKKSKPRKSKSAVTPMPVYQQMVTPALKAQCQKFGVRALPKKKMIKVLETIYYGTHPTVSVPEPEQKPKERKKRANKASKLSVSDGAATTSNAVTEVPAAVQQESGPKKKITRVRNSTKNKAVAETSGHRSSGSVGLKRSRSASARGSTGSGSDSDGESDRPDVPEESLMYSPVKDAGRMDGNVKDNRTKPQKIWDYIAANRELYTKILHYEPLELDEFVNQLKQAGIKLAAKDVIDFLDEKNILFTTRKSNTGWAARRNNKEGKRRKVHKTSTQQSLSANSD